MFKLIRLFIIPFVCNCFSTIAVAQSTSAVSGQVRSASGEPLSDAAVTILGTNAGAYTQNDGRFRIGSLKPGKYTLVINTLGYTLPCGSTLSAGALRITSAAAPPLLPISLPALYTSMPGFCSMSCLRATTCTSPS
ncbi:carboxypeptidase regulatory-like domain-containing protein [Chitinophaga pollutisoli]|uniref:carboxypeptidase regulatory-like domain-containing protein n=1 Tax=Chitinophaga pollutisoli TaxID=3133966 RepID=UPI00385746EF